MDHLLLCSVPGCRTRYKRSGKHDTCPTHAPCYVAKQYMPFHGPCLPCMNWMRAIANKRLQDEVHLDVISQLRECFKKILRVNKGHGVSVIACSDSVLLNFLKCRKGMLPPCSDLILCLKALRVWVDDEFLDLPSPVSIRSATPSVSSLDFPMAFSQVVKGVTEVSPQVEVAGPSSASQL